jgi:hypothetical protein
MPYVQGCSPGEEYIKHLCFKHYEQLAKEGAKAASLDFRKLEHVLSMPPRGRPLWEQGPDHKLGLPYGRQ